MKRTFGDGWRGFFNPARRTFPTLLYSTVCSCGGCIFNSAGFGVRGSEICSEAGLESCRCLWVADGPDVWGQCQGDAPLVKFEPLRKGKQILI